ncbi:family 1 glycosylhydrolase [Luedemannella flava]
MGFTDHRMSVNWAKVEPAPGIVDEAAVAHYRDVLSAGRTAGLRMWVSLLHTALPAWLAGEGGVCSPASGSAGGGGWGRSPSGSVTWSTGGCP